MLLWSSRNIAPENWSNIGLTKIRENSLFSQIQSRRRLLNVVTNPTAYVAKKSYKYQPITFRGGVIFFRRVMKLVIGTSVHDKNLTNIPTYPNFMITNWGGGRGSLLVAGGSHFNPGATGTSLI